MSIVEHFQNPQLDMVRKEFCVIGKAPLFSWIKGLHLKNKYIAEIFLKPYLGLAALVECRLDVLIGLSTSEKGKNHSRVALDTFF